MMSQTQKAPVRISAELAQPAGMVFSWLQDPAGAVGSPGEGTCKDPGKGLALPLEWLQVL